MLDLIKNQSRGRIYSNPICLSLPLLFTKSELGLNPGNPVDNSSPISMICDYISAVYRLMNLLSKVVSCMNVLVFDDELCLYPETRIVQSDIKTVITSKDFPNFYGNDICQTWRLYTNDFEKVQAN